MKEIIISIYDSAWDWAIVRKEKDEYYKTDSTQEHVRFSTSVEKRIYDSQMITCNDEELSKEKIIKELTELGYERIIICEDGNIEIYVDGKYKKAGVK